MSANERQVAGIHYRNSIQHWDFVAANNLDYFQGQITKYVARCKNKNGLQDLEKAQHFLEKYIELWKENKVADVNVNVFGVSMTGEANIADKPLARWRVVYRGGVQGDVYASHSTEKAAVEHARELNRKHEGNPYSVVDSEPGAPTSAYVDQG